MKKLVIIGNGIAGTTLARWVRKLSEFEIEMISDESPLFYSRTALMYVFMGDVKLQDTYGYPEEFFEKNNTKSVIFGYFYNCFQKLKILAIFEFLQN